MATAPASGSSRDKIRANRSRLRDQGLRPIQFWVPDVRAAGFKAQAHRQSLAVSGGAEAHHDQVFIDALAEPDAP